MECALNWGYRVGRVRAIDQLDSVGRGPSSMPHAASSYDRTEDLCWSHRTCTGCARSDLKLLAAHWYYGEDRANMVRMA
jgi:hypothetical protein